MDQAQVKRNCIKKLISPFHITPVIIKSLEHYLNYEEKVSIIFLLYEPEEGLKAVKFISKNPYVISAWCEQKEHNWKEKLIECIILIQNFKFLKIFGLKKEEIQNLLNYFDKETTAYICAGRKKYFYFCESLSVDQSKKLICLLEGNENVSEDMVSVPLEIYVMKWVLRKKEFMTSSVLKQLNSFEADTSVIQPAINDTVHVCKKSEEDCYKIRDPKRVGILIIVNQENYDGSVNKELKKRMGTHKDCLTLNMTMTKKNFKTYILKDLKHDQIFPSIESDVAKYFKPYHSILMIAILSHGEKDSIYGVNGKAVSTDLVYSLFSGDQFKFLEKIPKIFIFQCCRGNTFIDFGNDVQTDGPDPPKLPICKSITNYILCYSTIPGCKSFRHVTEGTWYIQTLCEYLKKYKHKSFTQILRKVKEQLEENPRYKIPFDDAKNIFGMKPEFIDGLKKELYLDP